MSTPGGPVLTLAALAVGVLATPAGGDDGSKIFPYPVVSKQLGNGLKVVAIPFDSPGVVAYHTIVRTGSRDEVEPGHSGFAHFFEHMMFRGTERHSQEEYNALLKRMGADSNAFTSDDRTQYYIVGPASELETMMDMESDRFKNLAYSEDVFRREALAVLGEYNKSASSPYLPMYEKLRDLAFERHTYKHTTIGFLDDIKAMPDEYEYSRSFFSRFYRPENCLLLVVGDADPEQVWALAERYYGDWQRGYQAPAIPTEPPPTAAKKAHLDWPTPIRPHVLTSYPAPAFSDRSRDNAALDLAAQLLFAESAPLYQKLVVEEQWVDEIEGGYEDHRDPYLFEIFARVKNEELVPQVLAAIAAGIAELQAAPVPQERLERIKAHLRYRFALGLDSAASTAFTISGYLNLAGDVESVNRVFEQYRQVTPADVQRAARAYLQADKQTLVTLAHAATPATGGEAAAEGR